MTSVVTQTDVLVVGLGPGGASAAQAAAKHGLRVIAIEKKKTIGSPVQCAEFIPMPMAAYAADKPIRVQKIIGMKSYLPSGAETKTDFPGLMIDRAAFDLAIAQRAQQAGAQLRSHCRLVAIDCHASTATIENETGREVIEYRCLIAADGPHSPTAKLLGLPTLATVQTRQYTVPLLSSYADTDIWLNDAYPGGYAWLFPKGDVANLGLGADSTYCDDLKQPLDALHQRLVEQGVVGSKIIARTGGAIPVGGLRNRLVEGRIVFVGDAAGLTHPITGAGISAAVLSGEAAGNAVAALLNGDDDALYEYEEEIRDQYESSLRRAVNKRNWLKHYWHTAQANEDRIQRNGWIAFDEYFRNDELATASSRVDSTEHTMRVEA